MTEVTSTRDEPLPTIVPALLSFVAGYVDSSIRTWRCSACSPRR
jgi:hypothetical protein